MTDQWLVYSLAAIAVYAVMQTIEVWSLRATLRMTKKLNLEASREAGSIQCETHGKIPVPCPLCDPGLFTGPYRTPPPAPSAPPPLQKPGPGRSRLG